MFDLGFAELVVIFVLGLLILGPKRMPLAIKYVAKMLGKVRATMSGIQEEINRELELEKLKETVKEATAEIKESTDNIKDSAKLKSGIDLSELKEIKEVVKDVKDTVSKDIKKVTNGSK